MVSEQECLLTPELIRLKEGEIKGEQNCRLSVMLPVKNRLKYDKDFKLVFKKGRSFFDGILGVKILQNQGDFSRFGIIVSSKVSKLSVERNLIKRRIRFFLQKHLSSFDKNYDCVIISLPPIKNMSYKDIYNSLEKAFIKMRVWKNELSSKNINISDKNLSKNHIS